MRRPPGVPGDHRPAMDNTCGFDGGYTGGPHCGEPATWHLFAGSPQAGPADWTAMACDEHLPAVQGVSWDWHATSAVCDVPGAMWQNGTHQGDGFCFWPEAEAALHESVSESRVIAN